MRKEKEEGSGKKLPNQEEEEDSSGRAPGEKRTNGEKREGELTSQRGGKEERKEEKTRGIGRIPNSTRATRTHFRRNFSMFPVSYFKPTLGKPSMIFLLPIPFQIWRDLVLKLGKTHKRVRWLCVFDSLIFETFSFNC